MSGYSGKIESRSLSGDGTFTVEADGLSCALLLEDLVLPYEDIEAFRLENFSVFVCAHGEYHRFYHMGQGNEWMLQELSEAYNQKVLSALLVEEAPVLTAHGQCNYGGTREPVSVLVFPDCLCILPQGAQGRRYPFAFVNGLREENYTLTVTLTTGEQATCSMLGADFDPLKRDITKCVQVQREKGRSFAAEVCPGLSTVAYAAAARVLREGIAAPLNKLDGKLGNTLINKAKNSKMGPYFSRLCDLGEESQLAIGLKALDEETVEELKAALLEKLNANSETEVTLTPQQEDALKWIVWAAIPSKDGRAAIVEFAFPNADAATYVFSMEGAFADFLPVINRAFEATALGREVFGGAEEKLSAEQRMLVTRTPAIGQLRKAYLGKAVHRSPDAWAKSIASLLAAIAQSESEKGSQAEGTGGDTQEEPAPGGCPQCGKPLLAGAAFCCYCGTKVAAPKICPACGVQAPPNMRFCSQCGTKL